MGSQIASVSQDLLFSAEFDVSRSVMLTESFSVEATTTVDTMDMKAANTIVCDLNRELIISIEVAEETIAELQQNPEGT